MSRAALLIGIDDYPGRPLSGCEADATALAHSLATHEDGSRNFDCRLLTSSKERIHKADVVKITNDLFSIKDADLVVFYFAGHGVLTANGGFLATPDVGANGEGVPMAQVIMAANNSPAREKIIILDCCHAGAMGELFGPGKPLGSGAIGHLSQGVSILAACRSDQAAIEEDGRGVFTSLICEALDDGGSADVRGFVTLAHIYHYIDEGLSVWGQRPLFKVNVERLVRLRRAATAITDDQLRRLMRYFPTIDHKLQLDPSFESTSPAVNVENTAIFADLQRFHRVGLVSAHSEGHLYFAAMNSKTCSLTPLGKNYWRSVKAGNI